MADGLVFSSTKHNLNVVCPFMGTVCPADKSANYAPYPSAEMPCVD